MSRRDAREKVVQALYQHDIHNHHSPLPDDWLDSLNEEDTQFYNELLEGIFAHLKELDREISALLEGWTLKRLPAVDRAILRLGAYELRHRADIPDRVTLNEAVELAKRFSTDQSSRYINGVLSRLQKKQESKT